MKKYRFEKIEAKTKAGEIVLREAIAEDAKTLARLEKETFPMPWSEESLHADIVDNELAMVVVAEKDGSVLGYANVWCVALDADLNNIAVFKDARGMGIGELIMKSVINRLKEFSYLNMFLDVRPSNVPAISLYKKLGFIEVGRRPGYYLDNGEDSLLLKLDLTGEINA